MDNFDRIAELESALAYYKSAVENNLFDYRYVPDEAIVALQGRTVTLVGDKSREVTSGNGQGATTIINGDNFHALKALELTHAGTFNIVYIDPPYNTGNTHFVYKDSFGKHSNSEWLSFMLPRLELAHTLLADSGVIVVSIDDNELPGLRMLLDRIFLRRNFIASLVWQGTISSLSKYTSGGVDYMVVYGKNKSLAPKWTTPKKGADLLLKFVNKLWVEQRMSRPEMDKEITAFIKNNTKKLSPALRAYNRIDEKGRLYTTAMLTNSLYRPNLRYDITDPATGKVYTSPRNGWVARREVIDTLITEDKVLFGGVHPRKKILLEEKMFELPRTVFTKARNSGSSLLTKIIGKGKFNHPKDPAVLQDWFTIMNRDSNIKVLDFFAGSGSTGHAVALMNAVDGGTRECVLVTNAGDSENMNIASDITYPRMRKVLTGAGWDDGQVHPVLDGSITYFDVVLDKIKE